MGETPVAEVSIESNFYCYMFCDGSEDDSGFGDPAAPNLAQQIAPGDSNVGFTP
jgi:hypothetical protein